MISWMYKWLPIIFGCHCRKERSFHINGKQFPICARCTGELVGIIISFCSFAFVHTNVLVSILIMIPMIVDGFLQALTSYESGNIRRFVTGLLFGYGLATLFLISTVETFLWGYNLKKNGIV